MEKRADLQRPSLPAESSYLPCGVCRRDIPWSTAVWRESSDYVEFFCGLECYDRWRKQPGGL